MGLLLELDHDSFSGYIVYEKGRIYAIVLKAIYGMLVASLLWYKKFRKELEEICFVFNSYDPCVANQVEKGKRHTIWFHIDDVLSSYVDPKVNNNFFKWFNEKYGSLKEVVSTHSKVYDYLSMTLNFTEADCKDQNGHIYWKDDEEFPTELTDNDTTKIPARNNLLEKGEGKQLEEAHKEVYRTNVAKALFLCKRDQPDIQPTVAVLATRV